MVLLTKFINLFNKKPNNIEEKINKIESMLTVLQGQVENKNRIVEKISEDFAEAKKNIDDYRNADGLITDYDGILLIQEVIDKLLIRFDYYYMNDGNDYPEPKLNLKFSIESKAEEINKRHATMERILNRGNEQTGITKE